MVPHALPDAPDLCQSRPIQGLVQQSPPGHGGGPAAGQQGTVLCPSLKQLPLLVPAVALAQLLVAATPTCGICSYSSSHALLL